MNMMIMKKIMNADEIEPVKQQTTSGQKSKMLLAYKVSKNHSKVKLLVEPRVYSEAQDIADHLKNRRAVVVNLQRIDSEQAKTNCRFLSGTVYALGGDIQKIGTDIFLMYTR